jgi:lipopolysaccharide/colanic/teichoic acid biosynthesis glycosyltransferase
LKKLIRVDGATGIRRHRALMSPDRLLSVADFRREVRHERMRADRRLIPFCVVRMELLGASRRKSEARRFVKLIQNNVRATDEKAMLGRWVMGLLLVDTPEVGGLSVVTRLRGLLQRAALDTKISMTTYEPAQNQAAMSQIELSHSSERLTRRDDGDDFHNNDFDNNDDSNAAGPGHRSPVELKQRSDFAPLAGALQWSDERLIRVDQPVGAEFSNQPMASSALKRAVDIVGASVGLLLSAPIIGAAMIAIRSTSEGPIFFQQMRVGRGGKPFKIYKLRTMFVDAEARQASLRHRSERDGPAFKMKDDPRVTRVGKWLRSTCIDELPQLLNVLKGEMSLVGPRPLPVAESRACQHWHRRRLDVLPGLTCDWQINKKRAETFDDWMRLDLAYVDRGGFVKDLVLILKTLRVPMGGRGGE